MKRFMIAATLLLTTAVHAEELMYYERPAFMAETMPLKIECKFARAYTFTCFEKYELPGMVNAKVVNTSGGNLRVKQVPTTYVATCAQGMCVSQRDQSPVGDVDFAVLKGHSFIAQTFDGYYLDKDDKEHLVAYKRGSGPKAEKYPPYAIYTEASSTNINAKTVATPQMVKLNHPENQTYSTAEVWSVWCEAGKVTCDVAGKAKDKAKLFKEMPVASWGYCQGDFCYGDESLTEVIGLNPAQHN